MNDNTVSIPISSEIIGELYLRGGIEADISNWIENVVNDYLDRTENDDWGEAYDRYKESIIDAKDVARKFGDPNGGLYWTPIFLPNGTLVRMRYGGQTHEAQVRFNQLYFEDRAYSPSQFARKVAAGTNRNAWNDLQVKRPSDSSWVPADALRRRQSK